jgi:large subunit ribosomal protein L18
MARSKIQVVPFRRKREGKTDYKKRKGLLLAGKPRLVIRRALRSIWLQVVEYSPAGDKVLLSAHSNELKKLGWGIGCSNIPSAYLTGLLLGKKAAEKKIGQCILDIGFYPSIKGNKIYAALKGAVDGGIEVRFSKEILPTEDRIKGKHIQNKVSPEEIEKQFEDVKQKIEGRKNG